MSLFMNRLTVENINISYIINLYNNNNNNNNKCTYSHNYEY